MSKVQRDLVSTPEAPEAIGPYSQAIASGGLVFCSGQIPLDPRTKQVVGGEDIAIQTRQVMDNLRAVLEAAQSGLSMVVKTTVYMVDLTEFETMNGVYRTYFEGIVPPARSTVEVAALPRGARVEIDAIAIIGSS